MSIDNNTGTAPLPKDDEARALALFIGDFLAEKKAVDVTVMNIGGISTIADYFVIAQGLNPRHTQSLGQELVARQKAAGRLPHTVEGESGAQWILIDYSDVIVHLFSEEARNFYRLESLWKDAPSQKIES